jgi:hypothetical protein
MVSQFSLGCAALSALPPVLKLTAQVFFASLFNLFVRLERSAARPSQACRQPAIAHNKSDWAISGM